jgi:hypothetical protein
VEFRPRIFEALLVGRVDDENDPVGVAVVVPPQRPNLILVGQIKRRRLNAKKKEHNLTTSIEINSRLSTQAKLATTAT